MEIGIIGAGEMGSCLASKFTALGHTHLIIMGFPVVKVFNSILATSIRDFGRPNGDKTRIAISLSGDDDKAKALVAGLVDELGFDSLDLGDIRQSWKQQPGSPIYCRDIDLPTMKKGQTPSEQAGWRCGIRFSTNERSTKH
jgi:predicted dinucleotide-binding enzyme